MNALNTIQVLLHSSTIQVLHKYYWSTIAFKKYYSMSASTENKQGLIKLINITARIWKKTLSTGPQDGHWTH